MVKLDSMNLKDWEEFLRKNNMETAVGILNSET